MADSAKHKKRPAATSERTRFVRRGTKQLRLKLAGADYYVRVGQLHEQGWRRLHALVGGHVLTFGVGLGDEGLAALLERVGGRPYHVRSITRARLELTAAGVLP